MCISVNFYCNWLYFILINFHLVQFVAVLPDDKFLVFQHENLYQKGPLLFVIVFIIAFIILSSKNKLDVGMVENATVGFAKYISRKLDF